MSPWPREPLALGLGAGTLACAGRAVAHAPQAWVAATLAEAFHTLRGQQPAARAARLLLAPELCRHFVMAAPGGLRNFAELRSLAAARALQLFGDGAWAVVADWSLAGPFACAALPQPLLQALLEATRGAGLAVTVESALLAALAPAAAAPGFVAFSTPAHVVLAQRQGQAVGALRCLARPELPADDSLQAFAAREAAREALRIGSTPGAMQWLQPLPPVAGEDEAEWASRLAAFGAR